MMICTIERVLPNTLYNDLCRAYEMQRYTRGLWNCGNCARNVKWKRNANVSTTYLIMYLILFLSCITTLVYTVSVWSHFVETHEWDFVDHYTSSWRLIAIHPVELAQEGHASLHIVSTGVLILHGPVYVHDEKDSSCPAKRVDLQQRSSIFGFRRVRVHMRAGRQVIKSHIVCTVHLDAATRTADY